MSDLVYVGSIKYKKNKLLDAKTFLRYVGKEYIQDFILSESIVYEDFRNTFRDESKVLNNIAIARSYAKVLGNGLSAYLKGVLIERGVKVGEDVEERYIDKVHRRLLEWDLSGWYVRDVWDGMIDTYNFVCAYKEAIKEDRKC